jgi:hypothetical protein
MENTGQSQLKTLQENLARDLVLLEDNDSVTEQQLDQITDTYAQVYNIVTKAIDAAQK